MSYPRYFNIQWRSERNLDIFLTVLFILQVKKRGLSLEAVKLQIQQLPLIALSLVGAVMTGMIAPGFSLLLSEILIVSLFFFFLLYHLHAFSIESQLVVETFYKTSFETSWYVFVYRIQSLVINTLRKVERLVFEF
jgi:hypothetical protein